MIRTAVTGRLAYVARLKLWDVVAGEEKGKLLFESEQVRASPLSELKHYWPELLRKAFKAASLPPSDLDRVEGVNVASLRVSLSRNNGAGMVRRRFTSGKGRDYLVTLQVEREGMVNVLQMLNAAALAPGRRPIELTFWQTGKGDWASIEFDSSVGMGRFEDEFTAAHPVTGDPVICRAEDMKEPSDGRTAILYGLEAV